MERLAIIFMLVKLMVQYRINFRNYAGNELNYYNRYSFNLMKRFEFLADQYAGFSVEHNVGSGF
jgi:hypothetical protein